MSPSSQWNILTSTGCVGTIFDIHGSLTMYPCYYGDPLSIFLIQSETFGKNTMKFSFHFFKVPGQEIPLSGQNVYFSDTLLYDQIPAKLIVLELRF